MQAADRPAEASTGPAAPELLRSAFRDMHGSRLHAFALLLTLGDRGRAAQLASEALAAGSDHVPELRHPERAAAWLRARVLHGAGSDDGRLDADERLESLADLHVGPAALAGLAGLTRVERAGLIATAIERLDRRDVAVIVGRDGDRLEKLLRRARRRYLEGSTATPDEHLGPPGPIGQRILESAARTMA
jgi:DNA-directed RNA polymerase specialized sigma24 family protein